MQQGLMSLPGAGQGQEQAPGQAAPMAALPQQQPRTPAAMTGRLEGLPPQQLMAMFTNPADTTPKWAVVTAYAKAIEQQRMMDAARGQSAMQQGQAQMGQPPVAAQVMMQPPTQTARHGGIMHGYSGGGAVAFQAGGSTLFGGSGNLTLGADRDYQDARRFGIALSPYDSEKVRADKLKQLAAMREFEKQRTAMGGLGTIPVDPFTVAPPAKGTVRTNNVAFDLSSGNPLAIPSLQAALRNPRLSPFERKAIKSELAILRERERPPPPPAPPPPPVRDVALVGAPSPAAAPAGITSLPTASGAEAVAEAERLAKAREAMLEGRRTLPPELLKAREGLSALEAANIAAQREATGAFGSESLERLQEARRRAQAPRLSDIEYLGRMLEGMKGAKRFGDVLVGGAAGAGRAEGERKAALAQAEKERREDTRLIRADEAAGRQLQILAAQRELAEEQGDFTRVQAIDDQIAGVREGLAAFKVGRADTEFEQGIKRFAAESGRLAAEAQKEGAKARAAGAAGGKPLTPRDLLQARLRTEREVDALIKGDLNYLRLKTPADKQKYRDEEVERRLREGLILAGYDVPESMMPSTPTTPAGGKPNDPLSIR